MSEKEVPEPRETTELEKWTKRFDRGLVKHYRDQMARADGYGVKVKQHPPGVYGIGDMFEDYQKGPFNIPPRRK